ISNGYVQFTTLCRRRAQRMSIQCFLHCGRAILRGIDQPYLVSQHPRNGGAEQRIMCAAKHERVDLVRKQRLKITSYDLVGYLIIEQSFLDQRDEQRTGATTHAHIVVSGAQRLFVRATADGGLCSDYADMVVTGDLQCCARSWLDHSDHRD